MKKYTITIKNNETGEEFLHKFDKCLCVMEDKNFALGNFENSVDRLVILACLIESVSLDIIQRDFPNEDKAHSFAEIPNIYDLDDESSVASIHNSIKDVLHLLTSAVIDNLYENTKKPFNDSYRIQVLDGAGNTIKDREASEVGIISSYNNGVISWFDINEKNKEDIDFKLFQTICNTINYVAKLSVIMNENLDSSDVEERLKVGETKIYKLIEDKIDEYKCSIHEHNKIKRLQNTLQSNDKINMIIDEEEYARQVALAKFNELMNGLNPDDEDEDEE